MELDIEDFRALRQYLTEHGYVDAGERVSFKKLLEGCFEPDGQGRVGRWARPDSKTGVGEIAVNLDWLSSPERIRVEANALRWLNCWAPPGSTPSFIFEDGMNHVMAMQAIPEEHEKWKAVLLTGQIVPNHFEQFGVFLGTIHRRSSRGEVSRTFADTHSCPNSAFDNIPH